MTWSNLTVHKSPFKLPRPTQSAELTPEEREALEIGYQIEQAQEAEFAEKQRALNSLMVEVGEKLSEILVDKKLETAKGREALNWVLKNPTSILTFVRSGIWHINQGELRRSRDGMLVRHPHMPITDARVNNLIFRNALATLREALLRPDPEVETSDHERMLALEAIGQSYLGRLEESYNIDKKNPVFAWEAYSIVRQLELSLPFWVQAYLDRCAKKVINMVGHQHNRTDRYVPEIFEFVGEKAPGAPMSSAHLYKRDDEIFAFLHVRMNEHSEWSKEVIEEAKKKFGPQDQMLRIIYRTKRAELGLPPKPKHETRGRRPGDKKPQ